MSRKTNPTTPEERAEWRAGPWNPTAENRTLRLLDDIEDRDRRRALLAASSSAENPEPCPKCGSTRKWSDYWTDKR